MKAIWITKAEYENEYKVKLTFNDGVKGIADISDYLDKPIYEPLKDLSYFKSFTLNLWTLEWENGADFSPEFLYDLVKEEIPHE